MPQSSYLLALAARNSQPDAMRLTNTAGDCFRQVVLIGTADVPPEFGSIPMRVGVGSVLIPVYAVARASLISSAANGRTVAEKIRPVQIYFWVPLPGGVGVNANSCEPQKKYTPYPHF